MKRLLVILILCSCALSPSKLFAANDISAWFKDSSLEFSTRDKIVNDTDYPPTHGGRGNIDCDNLTFTHRDGDSLPFLPVHKESLVGGCYISTPAGQVNPNGYINISGTPYVADITNASGALSTYSVLSNTDVFMSNVGSAPVGLYVWFDHLLSSLTFSNTSNGKLLAKINPQNQTLLSDKDGRALPVMADNFSVSDNGQWAVVDSPGRALIRINLNTMEVLPFTSSFEYGNGVGASIRTAITSDGRYVAVASKNYNYFKVFDLSTCAVVPSTINAPVGGCQSRDLNTFARSKITDMGGVLQMRFLTNDLIKFYASYNVSTTFTIGEYIVAAPNTYLTGMDYLAMGDSFSSGEGAQKYEVGTDEGRNFNLCHLSRVSYPYLIATTIQANNFRSVACSGAITHNIIGSALGTTVKVKYMSENQYDKIPGNNSLGDWLPGYKKQIGFISINNPAVITLSVGGNDIGFADKLIACIKPGTCFPTYEDRQEVFNEIDNKLGSLVATYAKTKSFATKNAKIYVIGYPQIALSTGNCGLNVHLNQEELTFISEATTRLNIVAKTAAEQAGVNYVDIEDAFDGFRLCENNTGNIAMNGLTLGNDHFIIGNESYHPNQFGHELMANKILGSTNNLGTSNPPANPATKLEKIKDTSPALKNAPKTGRAVKKKVSVSIPTKTAKKGKKVIVPLKSIVKSLSPNTTYDINVDGKPVGTITTDGNSDGTAEVTIPVVQESGPAVIDITGPDITGQPVGISIVIFVGNDGPDFDGDNVSDASDSCPIILNSGVDYDQDSVDDACDGSIGQAPQAKKEESVKTVAVVSQDTTQTPTSPTVENLNADSNITFSENGGESYQAPIVKSLTEEPTILGQVASATSEGLLETASTHPLRFLSVLLALIFMLIIRMMRTRRRNNSPILPAYSVFHT